MPDLARAYDIASQEASAIVTYERYLSVPADILRPGQFHRGPAHRRVAELYEARGDKTRAIEHYNAFVELWNGADSELQPQVHEIRERIARLIGEGR